VDIPLRGTEVAVKSRKRGRPALPESRRHNLRSRSITFRATPKLFAVLQQGADAEGVSLSDEITYLLDVGSHNARLQKDLARAMKMVGDWKRKPLSDEPYGRADSPGRVIASEVLRAAAHILIDARLSKDLVTHRGRSASARAIVRSRQIAQWMARLILSGSRQLGPTLIFAEDWAPS
jgi:hypothetical protein